MTILAGDIGGTKTLLQIATDNMQQPPMTILFEQRYLSAEYSSFETLLFAFFAAAREENIPIPEVACIGVAGPVIFDEREGASAKVTNLPWRLEEKELSAKFGFKQLRLINDFQAVGYGLAVLAADELVVLQAGENVSHPSPPPCILIGAGTGLGQGILVWRSEGDTGYYEVLGSEGGHGGFSPVGEEQIDLFRFLLKHEQQTKTPGRVSVEDVLSGRGLVNIYQYLAYEYPGKVDADLTASMRKNDVAAAVSNAANLTKGSLAEHALDLFLEIYGAQAGDFALACLAEGGVFIAGGIAAKIKMRMSDGIFIKAFQSKGAMEGLMRKMPVKLVLDPKVGLNGALQVASRL